jgi:predicted metal-dependent hydrolase
MNVLEPRQLELLYATAAPKHDVSRHQTWLAGLCVTYCVIRSRRSRGIALTIDEQGLRVRVPRHTPMTRIESVLSLHSQWISRKLAEWETRRPPAISWRAGATLMLKGEPMTLVPVPRADACGCDGSRLRIAVDNADPDTLAGHVISWLRATALDWFEQRAVHYSPVLAVSVPRIKLSNAKTRWGVCHSDGRVRLNWRLIQMPPPLIDYVVVHELAHLRELNHSPRFWRCVANVLPDHESRRKMLRLEGHRYLVV